MRDFIESIGFLIAYTSPLIILACMVIFDDQLSYAAFVFYQFVIDNGMSIIGIGILCGGAYILIKGK